MNSLRSGILIISIASIIFLYSICLKIIFFYYYYHDYPSYRDCAPSMCGNSTIQYPFGDCGIASAYCLENQTIQIQDEGEGEGITGQITQSSDFTGTIQFNYSPVVSQFDFIISLLIEYDEWFSLSKDHRGGTIYNCTPGGYDPKEFDNKNFTRLDWGETDFECFFSTETLAQENDYYNSNCTSYDIIVPAGRKYNISADKNFEQLQHTSFQFTWSIPDIMGTSGGRCHSCRATGGRCYGYYAEHCICRDGARKTNCHGHPTDRILSAPVMAELFLAVFVLFSIVVVFCIVFHRYSCCKSTADEEKHSIQAFMDPLGSTPPSVENFLNYYSSQVPIRYSHTQIMTYTNNLADKLGQGGFGAVYKGKLPSGRLIAVKVLDESKQSEQQFIAEVATVGTTCHVNLVRLLGYCSHVSRRALVYEYMVNGSLEKYIHGGDPDKLDFNQLYTIALGTARGIAYLHEECRNRILHFDIKPHNVLLDANFLPKVADFGLAKITEREESHISVANRGTMGYAAPEMWSRMYGVVTDRSDVYSYGMLLMEMVGGRENMDRHNRESRSSKLFYPEWAFKQVEKGEFGNLRKGKMSEEEESIAKMLSLVGLWCIQFNASRRPPMSKVIHMLEGSVEISTPPYPFPIDSPLQLSTSDQPSCSSYASEVQITNPTSTTPTQRVNTPPFPLPIDPLLQLSASDVSSALEIQMVNRAST